MSGMCKFGHVVLIGENVCTEDHPLATSLKCKLPGCSFSTDPVDKKYVKIAIRQLKSHLKECHSDQEHKENKTNTSTCPINKEVNCQTKNVIYCITCKKCNVQYIGETERTLMERFCVHLFLFIIKIV